MATRTESTRETELPNGDLKIETISSLDVGPLHVGSTIVETVVIDAEDRKDDDD